MNRLLIAASYFVMGFIWGNFNLPVMYTDTFVSSRVKEKIIQSELGNSRLTYANKDTLLDIVSSKGKIYLQKKDGSFKSIEDYFEEEKMAKVDSMNNSYSKKVDSIVNKYANRR